MTLRLGIIGAEGHLGYVLGELEQHPDVAFVGYAPSYDGEDVSRYAALCGPETHAYPSAADLLDSAKLDMVSIFGRYDRYGPLSIAALERGIHVLSEKPAALDQATLGQLEQAIAESGCVYSLLLQMRYWPAFYTAHKLVRQGMIGRPLLASGRKSYRWGLSRPAFYANREHYGSTMGWVGIHAFDFVQWAAGVRYETVTAYHANLVKSERPACQDIATVMATLVGGGSATFALDYMRPETAPTHGDDWLRIVGETGVIETCDAGERLSVISSGGYTPDWPLNEPEGSVFGDFVKRVQGALGHDTTPLPTATECIGVTRFALLAAQAADSGAIVHVA